MNAVLDTECLKVNNRWQPLATVSVRKAFEDMASGQAVGIYFEKLSTGETWPSLKTLEEWLDLSPGKDCVGISSSGTHEPRLIAAPRVILHVNYGEARTKEQQLTLSALARHYNYVCAVSGRRLSPEEWSREHVDPRSLGGQNGWDNAVLMDRKLNSLRGNKPYEELGLEEPEIKGAPRPLLPINMILNRHGYEEWDMFHIPRIKVEQVLDTEEQQSNLVAK